MALSSPILRTKKAETDLSAKQYYFVKDGTGPNGIILCSSLGELAIGVLMDKPLGSGSPAAVAHLNDGGTCKVILAEAVTVEGSFLTTDAAGKAILADTTGHRRLGRAMTIGSIGDVIEFEPMLDGSVP
jgi:hypothetical protein